MRFIALSVVVLGLLAGPVSAQGYQPKNPLYQPLDGQTERALARARQFNRKGALAEAVAEYDRVVERQPEFAKAFAERGFVKESLGDYVGAMADHDEVLRLAPDRPNSWSHAGWIRAIMNIDLDKALAFAEKAVALEATIDPVDTRGFVHFRRQEWDMALADYNAVLKTYPRSATTLFMRGVVKRRMGEAVAGDEDIARARLINKGIEAVWSRRGVTP